MKKNLLLVAYYFPPAWEVGSVRAWYIAKHLSRRGWCVTVVTPRIIDLGKEKYDFYWEKIRKEGIKIRLTGTRRVRQPNKESAERAIAERRLRKIAGKCVRFMGLAGDDFWVGPLNKKLSTVDEKEFNFLVASGSPFLPFAAVKQFSKRTGVPYVLDYRDPWTANRTKSIGKLLWVGFEKKILREAAGICAVSPSQAEAVKKVSCNKKEVNVVTNGYDLEDLPVRGKELKEKKVNEIIYAGSFFRGSRDIDALLILVKALINATAEKEKKFRFVYYGQSYQYVKSKVKSYEVEHFSEVNRFEDRKTVLQRISESYFATAVASNEDFAKGSDSGILTGKVFEILGMKVPLLLIAPVNADAVGLFGGLSLVKIVSSARVLEAVDWVNSLQYKTKSVPEKNIVDKYSWDNISMKLDKWLCCMR